MQLLLSFTHILLLKFGKLFIEMTVLIVQEWPLTTAFSCCHRDGLFDFHNMLSAIYISFT